MNNNDRAKVAAQKVLSNTSIARVYYSTHHAPQATKRREKLRFLAPKSESMHMCTLLNKYAEVNLAAFKKRVRDREAMQRADDDDDVF